MRVPIHIVEARREKLAKAGINPDMVEVISYSPDAPLPDIAAAAKSALPVHFL